MNRRMNAAIFGALMMAISTMGCAGKGIKKTTPPRPQHEEQETSMRGKEFISTSELATIYFDYDMADLSEDSRDILKKNAVWLKKNPKVEVQIQGHCDDRGTNSYNLGLGQRRATKVRDYYKALGIRMDRMATISYGEEMPVCQESTEECWQKNRRAETMIHKK
ncbi:MAG: peptidoglycan-associated lipoprotein Pal [Elusimicrobia bacterium]|nr:peptidoglycan-associated lipoprotein Pal [Elusimicrobiota bacterium]